MRTIKVGNHVIREDWILRIQFEPSGPKLKVYFAIPPGDAIRVAWMELEGLEARKLWDHLSTTATTQLG